MLITTFQIVQDCCALVRVVALRSRKSHERETGGADEARLGRRARNCGKRRRWSEKARHKVWGNERIAGGDVTESV